MILFVIRVFHKSCLQFSWIFDHPPTPSLWNLYLVNHQPTTSVCISKFYHPLISKRLIFCQTFFCIRKKVQIEFFSHGWKLWLRQKSLLFLEKTQIVKFWRNANFEHFVLDPFIGKIITIFRKVFNWFLQTFVLVDHLPTKSLWKLYFLDHPST